MNEEKQYLSKEKFDELTKELETLKTVRRKEIAEKLEFAKSLGDLKENAEYMEARQEQAIIEDRVNALEGILSTAEIISSQRKGGAIHVGSHVVVQKEGDTEKKEYQIVGSEEADMEAGKISNKSPIGEALIGKEKGETVSYVTPKSKTAVKILDVK